MRNSANTPIVRSATCENGAPFSAALRLYPIHMVYSKKTNRLCSTQAKILKKNSFGDVRIQKRISHDRSAGCFFMIPVLLWDFEMPFRFCIFRPAYGTARRIHRFVPSVRRVCPVQRYVRFSGR